MTLRKGANPLPFSFSVEMLRMMNGQQAGNKKAGNIGICCFPQFPADIMETDHVHPAAHILHGCDQSDKITITGEQNNPIQIPGLEQGINGQIHIRIGLGGHITVFIFIAAYIFLDYLEPALPEDIMIIVDFLPVFGSLLVRSRSSAR